VQYYATRDQLFLRFRERDKVTFTNNNILAAYIPYDIETESVLCVRFSARTKLVFVKLQINFLPRDLCEMIKPRVGNSSPFHPFRKTAHLAQYVRATVVYVFRVVCLRKAYGLDETAACVVYEKLVRGRVTAAGKAIRIERRRRSDSD
jgi:hypothetical protein